MNDHKDHIFRAIADSTRRKIIHHVANSSDPLTINDLSGQFRMSRQAVTKHVNVLDEAGLIHSEWEGRRRLCSADLTGLKIVADWVSLYQAFWKDKLFSLEQHLDSTTSENQGER